MSERSYFNQQRDILLREIDVVGSPALSSPLPSITSLDANPKNGQASKLTRPPFPDRVSAMSSPTSTS
ncbi:hypothetical protein PVAG01_06203 [Phlyctema vagabunda]|uniref:Uncharacterized protein n=1 Tax=Phlyctema vagabunda TaxID=108571 RepID=A0ABR4PG17_9HELO